MDQPDSAGERTGRITLTPDMRPVGAAAPLSPAGRRGRQARGGTTLPILLGLFGLLAGLGGLAAAAWVHIENQAETRRLATEIAQLRVSLDLYAQKSGQADSGALTELANRLAVLEQNWRTSSVPAPAAATATAAPAASGNEDCLPEGMRILVAEGDSYPICGQPVNVEVGQVANGYMVLVDGTTIASGGSMPLPGSSCTIGVTSSGDEGLTGYAEIRVTC